MSALGLILRARLRMTYNLLRGLRNESLLKLVVEVTVGVGLWAALYAASAGSLRFLSRFPQVREEVIYSALALLFMALTILLTFSSAIIALGSLFHANETAFLLATPVPASSVYAYRTFEGLVFSSWAFLVMGLPLMLAYGVDIGAPWYYYVGVPLFFVPLTVMTSAVGTLLGLALTGIVPRQRGRLLATFGIVIVAVGVYVALRIALARRGLQPFDELWKEEVLGHLAFLRDRHLPHTWLTRGLVYLAAERPAEAIVPWLSVVATAALAFTFGDMVARFAYRTTWSISAGGSMRHTYGNSISLGALEIAAAPAGRVPALFIGKDLRLFIRDPSQWGQVVIFFGLLGIYIANLRKLHYDFSKGFWMFLVSTLNLGATSLTLATLTTRFIFPQLSLEGRRFWVLGLAPLRRRQILYGKFAFALFGAFVVSEGLVILSNYMLRMPREVFATHAIAMAFICIGLTGLAVGLGAIFPNYRESNPSRIVSGFGGTLTLILSIVYVVTVVGLVSVPSQLRLAQGTIGPRGFTAWAAVAVALAGCATAAAAGIPLAIGARTLDRAEF